MSQLAYRNGEFIPAEELRLGYADAGFVFGATVTDFCRTYNGKLFRWPDHLARFRRDCENCCVTLLMTDKELTEAAKELIRRNGGSNLALITFATPGPLGYLTGAEINGPPSIAMHTFAIPMERYRRFFTEGVVLEEVDVPMTPSVEKHRSRMGWWIAGKKTTRPGSIPVLNGPDTAIGAILAVRKGKVIRPPVGTIQDSISLKVIAELCAKLDVPFDEGSVTSNADEMLLTGSAFGVAGVREWIGLKDRSAKFPWPGPMLSKLQSAWSEFVGCDITEEFQ